MTVQTMLEILILLPREMEVVMQDLDGDFLTVCSANSEIESIPIDEGDDEEPIFEDAFVLKVCTCDPDEDIEEQPVVPEPNQNLN